MYLKEILCINKVTIPYHKPIKNAVFKEFRIEKRSSVVGKFEIILTKVFMVQLN